MNDNERRQSDWLDAELDRLALDGDRTLQPFRIYPSEEERGLAETTRLLGRLDAAQTGEPDPQFLNQLEKRLMPSTAISRPWGDPAPGRNPQLLKEDGRPFRNDRRYRPTPSVSFVMTLALAFAVVLATVVVSTWDRPSGNPPVNDPGRPFAAAGESTPLAGQENSVTSFDPTNAAWSIPRPTENVRSSSEGRMEIRNGLLYRQYTVDGGDEGDGYSFNDDGTPVLAHEGRTFDGIQAIDVLTGETVWKYYGPWSYRGFEVDEAGVYSVTVPNEVIALDPTNPDRSPFDPLQLWSAQFSGPIVSMTLRDGTLYVWDTTHTMTAIDATTGSSLWASTETSDGIWNLGSNGSPAAGFDIKAGESAVVAVTAGGALVAFDRSSGALLWSEAGGFDPIMTSLAVSDEVVLALVHQVSSEASPNPLRTGHAFSLASGEARWSISITGLQSEVVTPGGTGMFHFAANEVTSDQPVAGATPVVDFEHNGSNSKWPAVEANNIWGDSSPGAGFVFGISAETGQVVWQRTAQGSGFGGLYISYASSERLWAYTYDNQLVLLNGEMGMILDEVTTLEGYFKGIVIGSVAEGLVVRTLDGIYGFGAIPSDQQG